MLGEGGRAGRGFPTCPRRWACPLDNLRQTLNGNQCERASGLVRTTPEKKIVSPNFIELCIETPVWCSSEGHQTSSIIKQRTLSSLNVVKRPVLRGSYLMKLKLGEQGWHSGESARLPPMWPGFDTCPVPYVG